MSVEENIVQSSEEPVKRKRGRPRKEDVIARQRPTSRVSLYDQRDSLSVEGKDPAYEYRWVHDKNESGQRIYRMAQAGWEFCSRDTENLKTGEAMVFKSEKYGNIYREPAGGGDYLYLMRIHKEWYDEDKAAAQKRIDESEQAMIDREKSAEGRYGDITIGAKPSY